MSTMHDFGFYDSGMRCFAELAQKTIHKIGQGSLVLVDIVDFSQVNHVYGYEYGGKILKLIEKHITTVITPIDILVRYSGDRFLIFYPRACDMNFLPDLYRKIDEALAKIPNEDSVVSDETTFRFRMTCANIDDNNCAFHDLFAATEFAMRTLKQSDESFRFCRSEAPKIFMTADLYREAFERSVDTGELTFFFQPKYDLKTRTITGAEALVRWYNKDEELFYPVDLILDCAERYHLMNDLAILALNSTVSAVQCLSEMGSDISVSLNLSLSQISSSTVISHFGYIAKSSPELVARIEIEVTEDSIFERYKNSTVNLRRLQKMGYPIAIDDFGKGYSNLQRIIDLQPRTLKVDKQFTDRITECEVTGTVVKTIVEMAVAFDAQVVAEGIETDDQVIPLIDIGVATGQGFHLSMPLTFTEFLNLAIAQTKSADAVV